MTSAIIGLLGVVIGAAIGLIGQFLTLQLTNFRIRKNLASAFAAEITSLIDIAQRRKYLEDIQNVISEIEKSGARDDAPFPPEYAYRARVKLEYFTVFSSNSDKLGMLGPAAADIVTFYTFVKSIMEDFSSLYEGERTLATVGEGRRFFKELAEIFAVARDRGNRAIEALRQIEQEKLYWFVRG